VSSNTTLTGNIAHDNENGYHLMSTDNNILLNNSAFNNSVYGFYLELSSKNTLTNNTADSNSELGILLSSSNNNSVIGNTVNNSGSTGLAVDFSDGNNVTGNIVENSFYDGIGSSFGNYNVFDRNIVYLNLQDGIAITSSSFDSVINNIAYNNSRAGFTVRLSSYNALTNNTAYSNVFDGFLLLDEEAAPASSNTLIGNTAHDNENGYHLKATDNNTLIGCVAYDNSNAGFFEEGTHLIGTTIINSWFYDNPWGIIQDAPQEPVTFTVIDSKLGNSSINISLIDTLTNGYRLNDTTDPSNGIVKPDSTSDASFGNKYLKFDFQDEPQVDELAFHWTNAEAGSFIESSIMVFVWNGTNWTETNQTLNSVTNNITVFNVTNITSDDIYGLYAAPAPPSPNEDNPLSVNFASSCEGNVVTVTSRGDAVEDARVAIDSSEVYYTDENGEITFEGCGRTVNLHVTKAGYVSEDLTEALVNCEQCFVPPVCECGQIEDNQCVPYQCCSDEDCPQGEICEANVCKPPEKCEPPSCCTSAAQCAGNETCIIPQGAATGRCEELMVCGLVENHTVVESWECGGAYCPECPDGSLCFQNRCVQNQISCPSTGFIGEETQCLAIVNGEACDNCDYEITDPAGRKFRGRTDGTGNFAFPLDVKGIYKVSILDENGNILKTIEVSAVPRAPLEPPEKPTIKGEDLVSFLWLLILIAIIIAGVLYMRKRRKGGKAL
jgi:parallel beta-helix repeat protein